MASAYIPTKTAQQIHDLGLSEATVLDVFNNGQQRPGTTKMYKKYSGYTVQVTYARKQSGEYVITWVAKWHSHS